MPALSRVAGSRAAGCATDRGRIFGRGLARHTLEDLDAPGERTPLRIGKSAEPPDQGADAALASRFEQLDAFARRFDLDAAAVAGFGDAGYQAKLDERVDDPAHRRRLDLL